MGGRPEEESGASTGFGAAPSIANRRPMTMNTPHARPGRFHQGHEPGGVPAGQARALHRRQALEAQQRSFRLGEPMASGPAGNSQADLAPVRLRRRGSD